MNNSQTNDFVVVDNGLVHLAKDFSNFYASLS